MTINIERFSAKSPLIKKFQEFPKTIYSDWIPEMLSEEASYWLALDSNGQAIARLSTHAIEKLNAVEGSSGFIGHYEAINPQAGILLLKEAASACNVEGASRVIGPIDGSTWQRFLLALPQKNALPFFLGEPRNPPDYPDHFIKAGFIPIDTYESRITSHLIQKVPEQFRVKRFDITQYAKQLETLYRLSMTAFSKHRFYRDITLDRFKALFDNMKNQFNPEYIFFAYDSVGHAIGFIMGYPDNENFILKIVAADLDNNLVDHLWDYIHSIAHQNGFKQVIHALMHTGSHSLRLSKERFHSTPYRHYALYEWINLPL